MTTVGPPTKAAHPTSESVGSRHRAVNGAVPISKTYFADCFNSENLDLHAAQAPNLNPLRPSFFPQRRRLGALLLMTSKIGRFSQPRTHRQLPASNESTGLLWLWRYPSKEPGKPDSSIYLELKEDEPQSRRFSGIFPLRDRSRNHARRGHQAQGDPGPGGQPQRRGRPSRPPHPLQARPRLHTRRHA
jgi:hypothetical protein